MCLSPIKRVKLTQDKRCDLLHREQPYLSPSPPPKKTSGKDSEPLQEEQARKITVLHDLRVLLSPSLKVKALAIVINNCIFLNLSKCDMLYTVLQPQVACRLWLVKKKLLLECCQEKHFLQSKLHHSQTPIFFPSNVAIIC